MDEELIGKIKKLGYVGRQTGFKDEEHYEKGIFTYKYWAIPEENDKLINTPFYYDKEKDFIHFTSIDSLFEILNSRHLRLYNLLNMDDKFELDYAQRELSFKVLEKENVGKEQLYSFSMCSSSEILNEEPKKKKHLLWKLHGKDGNGVVIRLKIENDLSTWRCYYLTKCFYDLKNFEAIKELNKKTDNEFLDQLVLAFIKVPIYEFENEIRIVFDGRRSGTTHDKNKKLIYPIIYPDKLQKIDKISYVQLPLCNFYKDEQVYSVPDSMYGKSKMPKISITEIILGYRYNEDDLKNLKERIALFDPNINVKMSDLKQYY